MVNGSLRHGYGRTVTASGAIEEGKWQDDVLVEVEGSGGGAGAAAADLGERDESSQLDHLGYQHVKLEDLEEEDVCEEEEGAI